MSSLVRKTSIPRDRLVKFIVLDGELMLRYGINNLLQQTCTINDVKHTQKGKAKYILEEIIK